MDTLERVELLKSVIHKLGQATDYELGSHTLYVGNSELPNRYASSFVHDAERAFLNTHKKDILNQALDIAVNELEEVKKAVLLDPEDLSGSGDLADELIARHGIDEAVSLLHRRVGKEEWDKFVLYAKAHQEKEKDTPPEEEWVEAEEVDPIEAIDVIQLNDLKLREKIRTMLRRKRIYTVKDLQIFVHNFLHRNQDETWKDALLSIKGFGQKSIDELIYALNEASISPRELFKI